MLQFLYWLSCFFKTLMLLSLVIFVPSKNHPKFRTQFSKGFAWLYLNEILFFFVSFLIGYSLSQNKFDCFQLTQLIINSNFVLLYLVVLGYFLFKKKQLISQIDVLSISFMIFSWLAFLIVGAFSYDSADANDIQTLKSLSYGLAWVLSLVKLIIQFKLNNIKSIGLSYIFLMCSSLWSTFQAGFYMINIQDKVTMKILIGILAGGIILVNGLQIIQRRENKKIMTDKFNKENLEKRFLNETQNLQNSFKCKTIGESTHYTESFVDSVDNY